MSIADTVVHIVDDEEAVRNSLAFLLQTSGFAVRVHETATEFLKLAPTIANGCLITDLRMPDMDGVELLRRLREAGAMLPAIVITGHGDVQMAVEAMKSGALDFIEKPFSDEVMISSITRAVNRAAEQHQSAAAAEQVRQRPIPCRSASGRCWAASWPGRPTRPSPSTSASRPAPSRSTAPA